MKSLLSCFLFLILVPTTLLAQDKFLNIYKTGDNYFMEIAEKTLQRDILVSITIIQGSARQNRSPEMRFGYGGDAVFSGMIRLIKVGDNIQLIRPVLFLKNSKGSIFDDFNQSTFNPIVAVFKIKSNDKGKYTIDISQFIKDDNIFVSLKGMKEELKLGSYQDSKSYITEIHSYAQNLNFKSYRSYAPSDEKTDPAPTVWEVGASWSLLPEQPMQTRIADARVGYFSGSLTGSLTRDDVLDKTTIINRWRLEPKPEDLEKYKRGELVEPVKPIVYYIDRATPEYLVPYFINAVKEWNVAFEKAGFKNAITAKLAPTAAEDSTYSEEDLRYSLISYKASPIPNAYGPMVIDPRSGEILNSHVAIFHSVLQLLQRWYFVMCAAVDPQAKEYPLSKDIMGKLAARVVTHEVGHTLGLRHDFLGSTVYSADSLRNVDFVRRNGMGASIMDYQRFDYLAQPGDGFKDEDFMARLGAYDLFAIEWGYRLFPDIQDPKDIALKLGKWVDDKRTRDGRLLYIPENDFSDPRVQAEDCGNDQIVANTLSIKNLKINMDNLYKWNPKNDSDYFVLKKRYLSILSHYDNCMNHILKIVGGRYLGNATREEKIAVFKPVPLEEQRKAVQFLCDNVFKEPKWLFRQDVMDMTGVDFDDYIKAPYTTLINKLVMKYVELDKSAQIDPNGYTSNELLQTMFENIFLLKSSKKLNQYDRMLQSSFLTQLSIICENPVSFTAGNSAQMKKIMMEVKQCALNAQKSNLSYIDTAHYRSVIDFIRVWENGKQKSLLSQN